MRIDKLTTKFQQALARRPEPRARQRQRLHRAPAPARRPARPGGRRHRLAPAARRASMSARCSKAIDDSIRRLPKVEGQGGEISISRDLNNLLNLTDKEATKRGDQFIASELFLLAAVKDKGDAGRLLKAHGANRRRHRRTPSRPCAATRPCTMPGCRGPARGAEEIHHRPHGARPRGQARPGHRPRRGDPPRDPGAPAPHQEQPGADRRAGRGQDRHRRGARAAHHQRRGARGLARQARAVARHGHAHRRAPSTAASSRSG